MTADTFSEPEARAMAERIARYWDDQGYDVKVWVEEVPAKGGEPMYVVRSNLVGGWPVGAPRRARRISWRGISD